MVYTPDPLVCVIVFTEVAAFCAVTLAPTTTAPLGSFTWPVMEPLTVCPSAEDKQSKAVSQGPTK